MFGELFFADGILRVEPSATVLLSSVYIVAENGDYSKSIWIYCLRSMIL